MIRDLYTSSWRQLRRLRRRLLYTISDNVLSETLTQLIQPSPEILFVHSSLSRCGHFSSGPHGILQMLRKHCQTLCLPTHTYCYTVDGATETYDPRCTESRIGAITNTFWRMPGVKRSIHPTHSLAAIGPHSEHLCENHQACETACGSGTPYMRLIDLDAAVLMFGATMNTYTLFHCAEDAANCGYLYEDEPYQLSACDELGTIHDVVLRRQDMTVPRRFTEMREELHKAGLLKIMPLGMNELLYLPSSKRVHEYTVNKITEDENHLVAT